jgi:UDP-N-acetylglucosamine--N-acetylmuramyl-(pentapeptide) pyrophosphoryl-undecaprenol N-acetylglucosamine transferase
MRFVLAGGGTGGHVYPALSVATTLRGLSPSVELLYLGTPTGSERRLVPEAGLHFRPIPAGQVRGKSPQRIALSAGKLGHGVVQASRALNEFRPAAVFATGGYASVPVVIAARLCHLPLVVFLPDVYPGWAVKLAARVATRVATTVEGALDYLPREKTVVSGYPLRPEFWVADRHEGRCRLGLGEEPVLLVSGASQGSVALNSALAAVLPDLLKYCEVVHLSGPLHEGRASAERARLSPGLRDRYHVHGYLPGMAWAMAAADLGVLRAGASCLAEPPACGLPAILVPGGFSDQRRNAEFMQERGAATVLDETRLAELEPRVRQLLSEPNRLQTMAAASRRLARPEAAETLAGLLLQAAGAVPEPVS